jgi:hypothetical protein
MSKQLTFIASGGRTGTKFFGDMLREVVSDCHSVHEPDMIAGLSRLTLSRIHRFGLWEMVIGRALGRTGVRVLGQALMEGRIDADFCARSLRASRGRYHASLQESLVVESYYAWWMVAERIDDIWPGAKLAGILRDPRDWITSWERHEPRRRRGALTEWLPPGPPHPARLGDDPAAAIWPELDQVGRLAWEWALICRKLDRAAACNHAVRVFRFEDIFGADRAALEDFVHFVVDHPMGPRHVVGNLNAIAGRVQNASRRTGRGWRQWTDTQVLAVAHFCGEGMRRHGYWDDPEWQDRVVGAKEQSAN